MDSSRFLIYLFDLNRFVRCSSRIRFAMAKSEQAPFCSFDLIADFTHCVAIIIRNVTLARIECVLSDFKFIYSSYPYVLSLHLSNAMQKQLYSIYVFG